MRFSLYQYESLTHVYLGNHKNGQCLLAGDGILGDNIEQTIRNVGRLGKRGMKLTNEEIIKIMVGE